MSMPTPSREPLTGPPTTAPAPAYREDAYAALRYPDFRRFLLGHVLASMGFQMQTVAVGYQLYEATRQPLLLNRAALV